MPSTTSHVTCRSFHSVSDWLRLRTRQEEIAVPLDVVPKLIDSNLGNITTNVSAELLHNRAFIVGVCNIEDSKGTLRPIVLSQHKKNIDSTQQCGSIKSDEMEIELLLPVCDLNTDQVKRLYIPKPLNYELVGLDLFPNSLQDYEASEDSIGSTWIDGLSGDTQSVKYRIRNFDFYIDDDLSRYTQAFGSAIGVGNTKNNVPFKDRVVEVITKIRNDVGAYTMHHSIQDIYKRSPDFFKAYEALQHTGHCIHISIYLADQLRLIGIPAFVVAYIKRNPKAPNKFKDGYFHTTVMYIDEFGKSNLINLEDVYPKGFNVDTKKLKTFHEQALSFSTIEKTSC